MMHLSNNGCSDSGLDASTTGYCYPFRLFHVKGWRKRDQFITFTLKIEWRRVIDSQYIPTMRITPFVYLIDRLEIRWKTTNAWRFGFFRYLSKSQEAKISSKNPQEARKVERDVETHLDFACLWAKGMSGPNRNGQNRFPSNGNRFTQIRITFS